MQKINEEKFKECFKMQDEFGRVLVVKVKLCHNDNARNQGMPIADVRLKHTHA